MASILVLSAKVPFTSGGQDVLISTLVRELKARGHRADTVELPFAVEPKEGLLEQSALWRSLDLKSFGGTEVDLVIATKFPTYYAKHPKKSVWLVHQHREIYDLFGTRYSGFSDDPRDEQLRRMLMDGDRIALGEAQYLSGISQNVIRRLKRYNQLEGQSLYPPLPLAGKYKSGETEQFVLSVGRLCAIKRVDLMIKALPIVHQQIKLKIVGTPDEPGVLDYFKNEISKHHLTDRVEFLGRVDDAGLLDLYSRALAVYYGPHNEDYGYVTVEAMASGRPVVTCEDSGGVLEFIKNGENGLVVAPTSDAIGHAVNRLVEEPGLAQSLGAQGLKDIGTLGLNQAGWDRVINGLLSPLSGKGA